MSKIRVYELAKELGVDNKVVITMAQEIGVPGRLSHSNSLDSSEADQIRRAVIRQAIGVAPESQIVTKRLNRATGETSTVVESRKGNVIRRRKKDEQEEEAEAAEEATAEAEADETALTPDSLFDDAHAPETETEAESEEGAADQSGQEQFASAEVLDSEPEVAEQAEATQEPSPDLQERKTPGPRVLGKIDLPFKRVVKPAAKKTAVVGPAAGARPAVVVARDDEDEEGGKKKGLGNKKRTKKREISRTELVDYEGSAPRRGGKTQRHKGHDDHVEAKHAAAPDAGQQRAAKRIVKITSDTILVGELAKQMSVKVGEVIAKLMELGVLATINQAIDLDTATVIAEEFDCQIEVATFDETQILQSEAVDDPASMLPRAPIVTVMGHVDHGKTSLLDSIRKSSVAQREHGGITQHIGAYSVEVDKDRKITFIDTPGHAAFTTMRARGAKVTDIVVLVVAADEGVMPQTLEALNHAKAAGVPIVVALNKIDRPGAMVDRIKKQLADHGLNPEEWGGDTLYFPVSALNGQGIKELLDGILLLAELKDLRANPARNAMGTVVESRQDKGRGNVATVLVQKGTLKVGDVFVAGAESGRVRSMNDYDAKKVIEAGPSTPVEITGLAGLPLAGDDFFVVESEAAARDVASRRALKKQSAEQRATAALGAFSLEDFAKRANNLGPQELAVILKADVHGSLEAVRQAIEQLSTEKVSVRVIHAAVGGINESDIQLALASRAVVIGFGVRAEPRASTQADSAGIQIRFHRIIYELLDDLKKAMAGLLSPIRKEIHLGRAEVRNTFSVPKFGTIAGCYVIDGMVRRGAMLRLLRDSRLVYEGKMNSLKRFKDDVREVQTGYECGISIEGFNDIKNGDVLEVFDFNEVAATID